MPSGQRERRPTRLLLAYASPEEAVNHLARTLPPTPEDVQTATERWQNAVADLRNSGPRRIQNPILGPLPSGLEARARAVATSTQFQNLLGQYQPDFGLVAIDQLISIQKMIYSELRDLESWDVETHESVFRLSVPDPVLRQVAIAQDQAALSYTMSSENPNLRIGGMVQADVELRGPAGGDMPIHVLGFFATHGGPWMHAAELQGRWFLRDGYHRAYFLLKRGVVRVPCVLIHVANAQDLGLIRPGFVGAEALFGEKPPFVGDFLDDRRSVSGALIPTRKVVRIRAEEFIIPTDS